MDDLSTKMRTYLAEIYRLEDRERPEDGYVSTSSLADMLMVSAPAVNRMVNRLKELYMLDHEPYQGIRLTEPGKKEALQYLRAHRIAEVFLSKVMGFDWEQVYEEAGRMSPALSDALVDRMAAMSGNPDVCPHGEPIPKPDGTIADIEDVRLSESDAKTKVQVTRMRTREADRLNYIEALGLLPGATLDVIHKAPFNGPMQLKVGAEYRIIGHTLADLIRVTVVGEAE
ncbi:MAG: metal-dependent transcriptional regulator [Chloroflexota bacterium]